MSVSAGAHERPEPKALLWAVLGSAFVFLLAVTVPLLTLPMMAVAAFPLAMLRLRATFGTAALATFMAAALVAAAVRPGLGVLMVAVVAPGLVLAEAMARGRGMRRGTVWAMAVAALELGLALLFANTQMEAIALAPWDEVRSEGFVAGLREAGLQAEQVEWWLDRATLLRGVLEVVYPAFFLVMGASMALGHALLLRLYLSRRDPGWLEHGEFEGARLPLMFAVLFVLSGAAVTSPPLRPLAYNVLLMLGFLFAVQGVAVVAFYARRLAAPPLLRMAVLVLVLVNPWAPQVLGLLGLFDTWFDFRKWAEVEE